MLCGGEQHATAINVSYLTIKYVKLNTWRHNFSNSDMGNKAPDLWVWQMLTVGQTPAHVIQTGIVACLAVVKHSQLAHMFCVVSRWWKPVTWSIPWVWNVPLYVASHPTNVITHARSAQIDIYGPHGLCVSMMIKVESIIVICIGILPQNDL